MWAQFLPKWPECRPRALNSSSSAPLMSPRETNETNSSGIDERDYNGRTVNKERTGPPFFLSFCAASSGLSVFTPITPFSFPSARRGARARERVSSPSTTRSLASRTWPQGLNPVGRTVSWLVPFRHGDYQMSDDDCGQLANRRSGPFRPDRKHYLWLTVRPLRRL
jgi:hypothetical protein